MQSPFHSGSYASRDLLSQEPPRDHVGPAGDEERYCLMHNISHGAYGELLLARNQEGEQVAIKRMRLGARMAPRGLQMYKREIRNNMVLSPRDVTNNTAITHPHINQFIEYFCCGDELFIVLQYAAGGTLRSQVDNYGGTLPEDVSRWYFQQIILGVEFGHKLGIVFRDIKLHNILMNADHKFVAICDLGFSKSAWFDSVCNTCLGTPGYMAPELLQMFLRSHRAVDIPEYDGKSVDLFATGVCLYIMIYGEYPSALMSSNSNRGFLNLGLALFLRKIFRRVPVLPFDIPLQSPRGPVSESCRNFMAGLLQPDPERRLTMDGILAHPWFKEDLPEGFHEFNAGVHNHFNEAAERRIAECPIQHGFDIRVTKTDDSNDTQTGSPAGKRNFLKVVGGHFGKLGNGMKKLVTHFVN